MKHKLIAVLLAAGFAAPVLAADYATNMTAVLAEMKRLAARIEMLEMQNKDMENALASERISEKDPELVTRVKYLETQVDAVKGPVTRLTEALDGVKVEGSLTAVAQKVGAGGTANGVDESRTNYRGDINITLPVGSMGDNEGQFFTHLRLGQGRGIGLRSTYTSTANTAAFQTTAGTNDSFAILAQAWYQLKMPFNYADRRESARDHLYVTVGKLDPFVFFDQNAAADDESAKFMNNAFVHNPLLDSGGDIGADAYGFQPGAILKYENTTQKGGEWALSLGAFSSDTGANFSGANRSSFIIGQAEMNTRFNFLRGTVRAYTWSNNLAQNYDGVQRKNAGWGVSADQKVLDALTLFGRYGRNTSGTVRFDRALPLGAELDGTPWSRSADSIGLALGSLRTSDAFRRDSLAVDANGDGTADFGYQAGGNERLTEPYYRFKLNKAIELTPTSNGYATPAATARREPSASSACAPSWASEMPRVVAHGLLHAK